MSPSDKAVSISPGSLREKAHALALGAKQVIAHVLFHTGLLNLLLRLRLRGRAAVLMYHRVLPPGSDSCSAAAIVVSPESFNRQLAAIRRWLRPMSADDLACCLERGSAVPSGSVVVTFDDGWQDNWQHALPILQHHRIPALVFLASGYIGTSDCFWQERLVRALRSACSTLVTRQLAQSVAESHGLPSCTKADRATLGRYVASLKSISPARVLAYTRSLEHEIGAHFPDAINLGEDRFLSWEQAHDMAKSGYVHFGSHGRSHVPFTALTPSALDSELQSSKQAIGSAVGQAVDTIAYPNGDWNCLTVQAAARVGYRLGFTTDTGHVHRSTDRLRMPRINICDDGIASTTPGFLCRIVGLF